MQSSQLQGNVFRSHPAGCSAGHCHHGAEISDVFRGSTKASASPDSLYTQAIKKRERLNVFFFWLHLQCTDPSLFLPYPVVVSAVSLLRCSGAGVQDSPGRDAGCSARSGRFAPLLLVDVKCRCWMDLLLHTHTHPHTHTLTD